MDLYFNKFIYFLCCYRYWIDRDSAKQVDQRIQKALFLFACTNSSINPIVYGVFNIRKPINASKRTKGSNTCTTEVRLQQIGQSNKNLNDSKQ